MSIQWYPGHVRRASNEMIEALARALTVASGLKAAVVHPGVSSRAS